MEVVIAIGGIIGFIFILRKFLEILDKASMYNRFEDRLLNLDRLEAEHTKNIEIYEESVKQREEQWHKRISEDKKALDILVAQKSMGFPWLANAFGDWIKLQEEKTEKILRYKKNPAVKAAEEVKKIKYRLRESETKYRLTRYTLDYYENLFPWLKDLVTEDESEEIFISTIKAENDDHIDNAEYWLTPEEFSKLSTIDKYQLALDRYTKRKKSKWEIGRDYERYCGYLWEQNGYTVHYQGIIDSFEDLGRDLIAVNNNDIDIIQCKCWASHKIIHEKHIFQLFGTTMEFWLNNKLNAKKQKSFAEFAEMLDQNKIRPIFITSTNLSDTAKDVADKLNITVHQNFSMKDYPKIKCNISSKKEKIYHLPFDQQYDKIFIENKKGECYVNTIKEAEYLGFRRAKRWQGSK